MSIICRDCKYWGGNNGKKINSVGDSRCLKLKRITHAMNYCNNFKLREVNRNEINRNK